MLPNAAPHQLVGHSPFGPHSRSPLQNAPLTQSVVGTIGSLHLQIFRLFFGVSPVLKHHPPGQSSLVRHFVSSMHVAGGSGVVDTSLHLHLWLKK